jgi:hypothetical protein
LKQLLIGCGSSRRKKLWTTGTEQWDGLVTLDNNPDHNPDVLWDLNRIELPFDEGIFDEVHAYDVLEHTGQQGDYKFFFKQWTEFWRILKPGGLFFGIAPSRNSVWALGDPSHTRIIQKENFIFLHQPSYADVGKNPISDFRSIYKADFDIANISDDGERLIFALQAVKPARLNHGN